jgi:hypothetical protein
MEIGVNRGLFWGKIGVEMGDLTLDIIGAYLGYFDEYCVREKIGEIKFVIVELQGENIIIQGGVTHWMKLYT